MDIKLTEKEAEILDFIRSNYTARDTLQNLMEGGIAISWGIEDIIYQGENDAEWMEIGNLKGANILRNISDEDAEEILSAMYDNHDANIGICWDTISYYIRDHFNI